MWHTKFINEQRALPGFISCICKLLFNLSPLLLFESPFVAACPDQDFALQML